jgi:hypothetical protein
MVMVDDFNETKKDILFLDSHVFFVTEFAQYEEEISHRTSSC